MRTRLAIVILGVLGCWQNLSAAELTGRFSMLGATARAEEGDYGYEQGGSNTPTADQQGLRLMLEEGDDKAEWSTHLRLVRTHIDVFPTSQAHSSDLFRYRDLDGTLLDESDDDSSTVVRYELDRLYYRWQLTDYSLSFGRQAVDWGSGRLWQPLNLFGSFSPTDLDTDYKPGIDAVVVDYFPSPVSSLTAVYAFSPHDDTELKDSAAVHYRRQVGEVSEATLVAGTVTGNPAIGGVFDSVWNDFAWRLEGIYYDLPDEDEEGVFWIAGIDYQFDNGAMLTAEYYDNSRGATSVAEMVQIYDDPLVSAGLQQQLSRRLIGLSLSHDIGPLLSGAYTALFSTVKDGTGSNSTSQLHQINISYSVSNESDLLASIYLPSGKGLSPTDEPQSEFGHTPMAFTLRLRFYF